MKIVTEMPKQGQFVMLWFYAGVMWSCTSRYNEGQQQMYLHGDADDPGIGNCWVDIDMETSFNSECVFTHYVVDEDGE